MGRKNMKYERPKMKQLLLSPTLSLVSSLKENSKKRVTEEPELPSPTKRPRGRPKKLTGTENLVTPLSVKRPRGRPPKNLIDASASPTKKVTSTKNVASSAKKVTSTKNVASPTNEVTSTKNVASATKKVTSTKDVASPTQKVISTKNVASSAKKVTSTKNVASTNEVTSTKHVASPTKKVASTKNVASPTKKVTSTKNVASPTKIVIKNRSQEKSGKKAKITESPRSKSRPKPQSKASAILKTPSAETNVQEKNNNDKSPNSDIMNNNNNNNNNNSIENVQKEKEVSAMMYIATPQTEVIPLPDRPSSPRKAFDSAQKRRTNEIGEESGKASGFNCKVCHKWFPNRYFQRKHMLMDHEDQLYECRVCSFNSVDPEKLKSHIIKLHVAKKEKVESTSLSQDNLQGELEKLIDKKVPRKVMMEDGVTLGRDVNSKMRYICALCNRIYTSKYSLERHVRCHTLEKPYNCDVCSFSSSYREHMMRHVMSVHLIVHSDVPKVKYIPKKKRDNDSDDSNTDHDSSSSPGKKRRNILRERFECAVCGLKATHKTDLMDHIRIKHPNAHIESLVNNDGSKVHLIVTNAKKVKPSKRLTIQCKHCSLIFHDTWKYKVHLRSHTGVKPFECSVCELKATSKMTIRDHIHRKHKESDNAKIILRAVGIDGSVELVELPVPWREFKCEHCNEQFRDNYNLKLHKSKNHPDEMPFLCIVCCFKERTKAKMIIHCANDHPDENVDDIIMHNGKPAKIGAVKMPTCEICKKVFAYRSLLNIHIRLHTGEKELSCSHCDYQSNSKSILSQHIQKKHLGQENAKRKQKISRKKKTMSSVAKRIDDDYDDIIECVE